MTMDPQMVHIIIGTGLNIKSGSRNFVKENCSELKLHDIWREMNGNIKQYSWRSNPIKCARLDFFHSFRGNRQVSHRRSYN